MSVFRFFGRSAQREAPDSIATVDQHDEDVHIHVPVAAPAQPSPSVAIQPADSMEDIAVRTVKLTFPKDRRRNPPTEDEIRTALGPRATTIEKVQLSLVYDPTIFT